MDEIKQFFGMTEFFAQFPFLEKLALLGIVIVFANKKIKDRFKKIDEDKASAELQRQKDREEAHAHREAQAKAMSELTAAITGFGSALAESSKEYALKFANIEGRQQTLAEQNNENIKQTKDLAQKIVILETNLQLGVPKLPGPDLTL